MKPPKYDDLEPIVNGPHPYDPLGWRQEYKFEHGYGASLIFTEFSYGLEIAVLYDGHLTYDTWITNGVLGHLTYEKAHDILLAIKALPPKEWYCKYLERITHRKIMDFIGMTKNLGNYEVSPKIFDSPDKDKIVLDICESLSEILNLPLCTIFHQIIQPECKECTHMVIREKDIQSVFPTGMDHQIFCIFDEECPYHAISKNVLFLPVERYTPPQGCDCWRPK